MQLKHLMSMWHQWFNHNLGWSYENNFCEQKQNKKMYSTFSSLPGQVRCGTLVNGDRDWPRRSLYEVVIFFFVAHKKYSCCFVKLWLNHMDYFNGVVTNFLGHKTFHLRCCPCRVRKLSDLIKNILIFVLKMNEGLTGLERHQGEHLMTVIN